LPTSLPNTQPIRAQRKWRVLIAHNRYQQSGGEDAVVDAEVNLLREHDHEVVEYQRENHDLAAMPRAQAALQTLWSSRTTREVGALIDRFAPDVLHVHNTFPLISPSIYWLAHRRRLPVVQTLHNFRLICPQALMLRNGKPCEDCVGKLPWRGIAHACYRNSRLQTGVLASAVTAHALAGTWQHKVTRYIALNTFCRDRFIAGGLPAEKIVVKPNFVDLPAPGAQARAGFLFVGRLSVEKGVQVLADAVRYSSLRESLTVVGIGPEAALVQGVRGIQALGALAPDAVYAHMRQTRALVLPSICYENFPRTLVEAYACALPVIASRLGAMAALVEDGQTGLLFEPGNSADLAAKLAWALDHKDEMAVMGQRARARYEAQLTGPVNLNQLLEIYRQAISKIDS
jgi:glycosyltransferase involved in cell wall biosynthesis